MRNKSKKAFLNLLDAIMKAGNQNDGEAFANALRWAFICIENKEVSGIENLLSSVNTALNKKTGEQAKRMNPRRKHLIKSVCKIMRDYNISIPKNTKPVKAKVMVSQETVVIKIEKPNKQMESLDGDFFR